MTLTTWAKDHRLLVIATLLHLGLFAAAAFRPELARAKAGIAAAVRQSAAC
jgi:hypothetical protein